MRYVKQEGLVDCGICCLYNIIRYYKGNMDIEKLRRLTNTNENGTSIYNLINVSNKIGFLSKAYKCKISDLYGLSFPLIALIKINNINHFVIIDNVLNEYISIFDPIRGRLYYSHEEFKNEWQNIVITFDKKGNIVKENSYYQNYLFGVIKENKKRVIILIILSLLSCIFGIVFSLLIKGLFDKKINQNYLAFFIIILIKELIDFYKYNYSIKLNNDIDYTLSSRVYEKIYSLPTKYHHLRPIGDTTSKINDLIIIKNFLFILTTSSLLDIIFMIFVFFIILFIDFKLFLILLIISAIYIFLVFYLKREEINLFTMYKEKEVNLNSKFVENLIGIDTIKNLNIDNKIIDNQKKYKVNCLNSYNNYSFALSLENLFSKLLENYGIIILLFTGIYLINNKKISIGELTMIYSLFMIYFNSLKNIVTLYKAYNNSYLSFKKINNLLSIDDRKDGNSLIKNIENIVFNNVSYSFNNHKVLNKFCLNINKGDYILLYGESGKGKSTVFKLLNKDIICSSGDIFINSININDLKESSIKNNICLISQKEYIFTDSLKNNILMYKNVKSKEIEKALKVSMLDKVIKKKNINLDYIIEENGINLSGGERQKLLIARALVRDTKMIVFDETMNEIDIETERIIIENIKKEYDKTIVLISHRLNNKDLFSKVIEI